MPYQMRLLSLALAALLAACGDGGPETRAVRVAGDSLSDSGTFGFKATVQGSSLADTWIWTDHVAHAVGVAPPCPRYLAANANQVAPNTDPAFADCRSNAVVRARINVPPDMAAGDDSPFSILQQLEDLSATRYDPDELLLLDGGGNDLADLMRGFLTLGSELQGLVPFADTRFVKLLGELGIVPASAAATDLAQAGAQYMAALADRFSAQIRVQALERGAQRVVLLNLPDLVRTPYFQAMLAAVAQANGGGNAGQAAALQVQAMADGWIQAFNTRLQAGFAAEARVAVVDFHAALQQWVTPPAVAGQPNRYGFSNTTTPACAPTGTDAMGLPSYFLGSCLAADLSHQLPQAALNPGWWTGHVFADDFHGGPRTNQLMAELVLDALRSRGWY
ncbi:SGNH/GDSL hydrolase family protein [Malikia granosa]|nr:SGNH/GDSL hydrolase family protein [Malikia granosa]